MELADGIGALAGRIEKQRDRVLTEEACKNAFVMPFLTALGYDVFDPEAVVPEFIADVGVKSPFENATRGGRGIVSRPHGRDVDERAAGAAGPL